MNDQSARHGRILPTLASVSNPVEGKSIDFSKLKIYERKEVRTMTYMKPELVELMSAARIIQSGDTDGGSNSDVGKAAQFPESTSSDQSGATTTSSAYQADE